MAAIIKDATTNIILLNYKQQAEIVCGLLYQCIINDRLLWYSFTSCSNGFVQLVGLLRSWMQAGFFVSHFLVTLPSEISPYRPFSSFAWLRQVAFWNCKKKQEKKKNLHFKIGLKCEVKESHSYLCLQAMALSSSISKHNVIQKGNCIVKNSFPFVSLKMSLFFAFKSQGFSKGLNRNRQVMYNHYLMH